MTKREWLNKLMQMLRPPDIFYMDRRKAFQAAKYIRAVYSPKHKLAAQTCIDTLHLMIRQAQNYEIRGRTQKELATNYKWSEGTFGKYTRVLENIGLIDIDRGRLKNGRVRPNGYILTFLKEIVKLIWPVGVDTERRAYQLLSKVGAYRSSAVATAPT